MIGLSRGQSRAALVAVLATLPMALSGVAASATTLAPTTTTLTVATTAPVAGQPVRMKATVKENPGTALPTGTVKVTDSGTAVGSGTLVDVRGVMTAIVKVSLKAGNHSLVATYSGDVLNTGSASAAVPLVVAKASTTVTVTATALSTPGAYKIQAWVKVTKPGTGIPTGSVTFVVDGGTGTVVALSSVGHAHIYAKFNSGSGHSVAVSYPGDSNFIGSVGTLTFTA